jgi:nitroreductase
MDAIEMLLTRASNGKLNDPAPDEDTLQLALQAAARAPDHALLRPWRVLLVRGAARQRLGMLMRDSLARRQPSASEQELEKEQNKPLRAPLLLVVAAQIRENPKAPAIEQILSAGAAAQNVLLALHARGFAAMWRTGPAAYDPEVKAALGLRPEDAIVGFIYAGTPRVPAPIVPRPAPEQFVQEWTGPDT